MYFLMSSAMMCEFFLPRSWFCVISAPGITSMSYCASARAASRRDVLEIGVELAPRDHRKLRRPSVAMRPARASRSLLHQDVIGDRDHVELARLPVQIDDLARADSRPSLQRVWTWKSQSRNGS